VIAFNPHSHQLQDDPYPVYRQLRDEYPILHVEDLGFWAISRYDDVKQVLLQPNQFSSMRSLDGSDSSADTPMIVIMDPPRHDELRSLLNRAFTPRRIADLEPRIRAITTGLIDRFIETGSSDLWRDLSAPLPTTVIAELLGVPSEDQEMFKEKSTEIAKAVGPAMTVDPASVDGSHPAVALGVYLAQVFEKKRAQPADDLMSALLAAEIDGKKLSQAELVGFAVLLLIAGNETTTNLISNAAVLLEEYPDERARLLEDPSRIELAVDEFLRFESPVQGLERIVNEDTVIGAQTLRRGEKIFLMLGSANRDERSIAKPDRLDVYRSPNPQLGFGFGAHFCLGASLARMETRIALEELLKRVPDYHVAGPTERLYSGAFRGLLSVPIEFGASDREIAAS
jgi:cytochrome P450